jgi:diaminopimelate decarboxylase
MKNPRFEYSRSVIQERINLFKSLSAPYGLTIRYAIKANPHPEIIHMIYESGISFDASSSYEASDLLSKGIKGDRISLSSQQSAHNLKDLLDAGVLFVATSINQLKLFLEYEGRPSKVGIRINPNVGYGHNKRTNTGGINSSFGIWHEYIDEVLNITSNAGVSVDRVHIHVGSGADPSVWAEVMDRSLEIVEKFKDATSLDIGGGYKVHRYADEKETDMKKILDIFGEKLKSFSDHSGRRLHLEIEPGTYFVAHAGTLIAHVDDIVDTGKDGHMFLRLNTGMNDFLRTSLYGARHKIEVINESNNMKEYVVVGHNCESGDILTTVSGNPEEIEPRLLKEAKVGDEVRIYDVGAYCASMRAKGYNSFPDALEVMVD